MLFSVNMAVSLVSVVCLVVVVVWDLSSGHQTLSGRCVWRGWCVWLAGLLGSLTAFIFLTVNMIALRGALKKKASLQRHSYNHKLLYPWLVAYAVLNSALIPAAVFLSYKFSPGDQHTIFLSLSVLTALAVVAGIFKWWIAVTNFSSFLYLKNCQHKQSIRELRLGIQLVE